LSVLGRRVYRALRRNVAQTAPDEPDPRLRGRTYAIPFDRVWEAARRLANGGLRRWHVVESDDYEGVIRATSTTFALRMVDDVEIRIGLDQNAQTRVDVRSASRKGVADLGTNARRIGRFLRALDKQLTRDAKPRSK
jgi:uncharacterized protein (DUF1499 family)